MMNRRDFLARTGMGMGALSLGALAHAQSAAPPAPHAPHFAPKAKSVIRFFLNGGTSHVDTFDPKPALSKYAGQPLPGEYLRTERKTGAAFPSPFKFTKHGQSGLEISELFAKTAAHADSIAVVRSMYAQMPNHEPSLMLMNCGDSVQARPSFGAWTLYGLGAENQNLPGFVAMCPGGMPIKDSENWQAGFLPGAFQGTFEDTLILWGGEFGRTPTVELGDSGKSKLGRDHNHYGFSVWLAGGGVKGGSVYGATDEFGFNAIENRASVHDLHATMLHLLGFDHERLTYRHEGRDFRLTDVSGEVIKQIVA